MLLVGFMCESWGLGGLSKLSDNVIRNVCGLLCEKTRKRTKIYYFLLEFHVKVCYDSII